MKFFLYISDTKVEMLFDQVIESIPEKISWDIGLDLKFFQSKRTSEKSNQISKIKKCEIIERYLFESDLVGNPLDDKPWIKSVCVNSKIISPDDSNMTFFVLREEDYVITLGGSNYHLIGGTQDSIRHGHLVYQNEITKLLTRLANDDQGFDSRGLNSSREDSLNSNILPNSGSISQYDKYFSYVDNIYNKFNPLTQNITFLTKVLFRGIYNGKKYIVGTPLYVVQN